MTMLGSLSGSASGQISIVCEMCLTWPRLRRSATRPIPLPQERVMKRLHVHVSVDDLAQSIRFYSTLFAAEPTVLKTDYAKWMLDDPRVNFAISTGSRSGHAAGFS